jgi:hypothetical protein
MKLLALLALVLGSCAIVPKIQRRYLADPTMQDDPLDLRSRNELHQTREAAAGGDGEPAGGGCGCGN